MVFWETALLPKLSKKKKKVEPDWTSLLVKSRLLSGCKNLGAIFPPASPAVFMGRHGELGLYRLEAKTKSLCTHLSSTWREMENSNPPAIQTRELLYGVYRHVVYIVMFKCSISPAKTKNIQMQTLMCVCQQDQQRSSVHSKTTEWSESSLEQH